MDRRRTSKWNMDLQPKFWSTSIFIINHKTLPSLVVATHSLIIKSQPIENEK